MKALLQGLAVVALLFTMAACGGDDDADIVLEDTTVVEPIMPAPIAPMDTMAMDTTMADTTGL